MIRNPEVLIGKTAEEAKRLLREQQLTLRIAMRDGDAKHTNFDNESNVHVVITDNIITEVVTQK